MIPQPTLSVLTHAVDRSDGVWQHSATFLINGRAQATGDEIEEGIVKTEFHEPAVGWVIDLSGRLLRRDSHIATLFPASGILIAEAECCGAPGQCGSAGSLAITELFDLSAGTLDGAVNLRAIRALHLGTLHKSDDMLIAAAFVGTL